MATRAPLLLFGALAAMPATSYAGPEDLPDAEFLRAWYPPSPSPSRMALGPSGEIYVSHPYRGVVTVRAEDGALDDILDIGGAPLALAIDLDGRLIIGDTQTGSVSAYDVAGTELFTFGAGVDQFDTPSAISVSPLTGDVYVTDGHAGEVQRFDASGTHLGTFWAAEDDTIGPLNFPSGVHVDDAGVVWVADLLDHRLRAFDSDGAYLYGLGEHGEEEGELYSPQGIRTDGYGRLYVVDARLGWVTMYSPEGDTLGVIGEFGTLVGQLRVPMDLVLDDAGRLVVASSNNDRLELFALDDATDPEVYAPAKVSLSTSHIARPILRVKVRVEVEVPGYRAIDIDAAAATVNGLSPLSWAVENLDGDPNTELGLLFDMRDLRDTLPTSGGGELVLISSVGGLEIYETIAVTVSDEDLPPDDTGDPGTVVDTGDDSDGGSDDGGSDDGGQPDADDTGDGAISRTSPPADGCGCSGGGAAFMLPLLPLSMFLRRRRRTDGSLRS